MLCDLVADRSKAYNRAFASTPVQSDLMSDSRTLLPEGLRDVLPPDAGFESAVVDRLKRTFTANGYVLVKPPLVEFEETLLSGVGTALASRIFRMLDPVSHRTLGVRADITTQIARIAATRLAAAPRPLRIMYAGQVLRVKGSQLEPERQFSQAGFELVGAPAGAADAEAILVVAEALDALGVKDVSIDLGLPTLVPAILAAQAPADATRLRAALDHKDVAEIKAAGGAAGALLTALVEASGPYVAAYDKMLRVELPPAAQKEWQSLVAVAQAVRAAAPNLALTVDAVENRGFEYHTGVTFSVFARGAQRELCRGGRYLLGQNEPATGATFLVDALLAVVPRNGADQTMFAPFGTKRADIAAWQGKGWRVVAGLAKTNDDGAEARRLGCTHVLAGNAAQELKGK
jgi:ATP phosphoribosyltransferase regulatory subunit